MRPKKCQISMETLMITGMVMLMFVSVFIISEARKKEIRDYEDEYQLKARCEYISSIIDNVASAGDNFELTRKIDYNFTVLAKNRQILVWKKTSGKNLTYYCDYLPYNVTNMYNTSFTIPKNTEFKVRNNEGEIEIIDQSFMDGLVLWYTMEDGYEEGVVGKAKGFDGDGDYVNISGGISQTGNFSIVSWIKTTDTASVSNQYILDFGATDRFNIGMNNSDGTKFSFYNGSTWVHSTKSINDGKWHLVSITKSETNYKGYIDNNEEIDNIGSNINLDANNLIIGSDYEGDNNKWNGTIDEITIFDRALTSDEISTIYNRGVNSQHNNITDGLVAEWRFESNFSDSSSNSNDGTWNGGGTYQDFSGNNNIGTAYNNAHRTKGKFGDTATFDGDEDYINIGDPPELEGSNMNEFTVSTWVYHNSISDDHDILVKGEHSGGNPFILWRDENTQDSYAFFITDTDGDQTGSTYSSFVPLLETWTHLSLTFIGNNETKLYINGTEDENSPFDTSNINNINSTSQDWYIGSNTPPSTQYFEGSIDEVMIFNRSLSEDEVKRLYDSYHNYVKEYNTEMVR